MAVFRWFRKHFPATAGVHTWSGVPLQFAWTAQEASLLVGFPLSTQVEFLVTTAVEREFVQTPALPSVQAWLLGAPLAVSVASQLACRPQRAERPRTHVRLSVTSTFFAASAKHLLGVPVDQP